MRGYVIAILVFFFGAILTLVLERVVKNAPELVWRLMYVGVFVVPVVIVVLSDPSYRYLAEFRKYAFASTLIVAVAAAIVTGTIWLFGIIGFPSSKSYLAEAEHVEKPAQPQSSVTRKIPDVLLASQIQELRALQDFLGGKDEGELWELFDLPGIVHFNIRRAKASIRSDALTQEEAAEVDAFFKGGKANLDIRYCTVVRTAGGFHYEPIQGKLGILNLSRKYVTNRQTLAKFQSSPQLPVSVKNAVKELDEAVYKNVEVLLDVINEELAKNPDHILHEEDANSPLLGGASGAFLAKRVWLKPKQEAIMSSVTDYLNSQ